MPAAFPLLTIPYPLGQIKLGALIPNIEQPNQDALDPTRPLKESIDFKYRDQNDFNFVGNMREESSIRAEVTRLLSFRRKHAESERLLLQSTQGRTYELTQPRKFFAELCKDVAVRDWLINCVKDGDKPYFVTALQTYTDTVLVNKAEVEKIMSIEVKAPVGTAATLACGIPGASVLDSSVGGESGHDTLAHEKSKAHNERIFAICVRKVRFKWFSQDELNGTKIDKDNRWVYAIKPREEGAPPVKDIVETDLEETDPEFPGPSELVEGADGLVRFQIIET